jgi:hypothetical protein
MRTAKHKVYCAVKCTSGSPGTPGSHPQDHGRPADHEVTTGHHPRYHQLAA